MKRLRLFGVLVLLGLLVAPLSAGAASGRKADAKTWVVLVGIDQYGDTGILPRRHAEADVKAFYDLITGRVNQGLYQRDSIKVLLGKPEAIPGAQKATRENILAALDGAFGQATEDDTVLLVWLGQGAPVGNATCYFAVDSTIENRAQDAITSADIETRFSKIKSQRICVILDVNFRGYKSDLELPEFSLDRRFQEFSGISEESEDATLPKPFVLLSATNGMEASAELEEGSLFIALIQEGLRGKADKFGDEADGVVTIDELVEYVGKEYPGRAKRILKKDQFVLARGRSTHFVMTTNPEVAEEVAEQLKRFQALADKAGLPPEVVKEGVELLSQMPRLESLRDLRKKYQALVAGKLTPGEFQSERDALQASIKLSRDDAEEFCDRVFKVARIADENYVKPVKLADLITAGIKGLYRHLEEKLPAELQERVDNASGLSDAQLRKLVIDARMHLGRRPDIKKHKDSNIFLEWMLNSLDQHSTYISPEALREFERQTNQRFIGVGIRIVKDFETDLIRVSTPIRGSPAYEAGIRTGDLLTKIINYVDKDGRKLPEPTTIECKGMATTDAVTHIVGKRGTKVTLVMERKLADGTTNIIPFDLIRNTVVVETILGVRRNPDDSWDFYLDRANKIAYLRMTQFAENTDAELRRALADLRKTGINGLILDLRFNPGGMLSASVDISNLFIDDGSIVSVRPRNSDREQTYRATARGPKYTDFPMIVLVNGQSASASEIVSACLQDQERCIVMGERSYGKGSVQTLSRLNLGDGQGQVKLTIASFWRPNGKNLNRFPNSKETDDWGVSPLPEHTIKLTPQERLDLREYLLDHESIPNPEAKKDSKADFTDKQLNAALELVRKQAAIRASRKAG